MKTWAPLSFSGTNLLCLQCPLPLPAQMPFIDSAHPSSCRHIFLASEGLSALPLPLCFSTLIHGAPQRPSPPALDCKYREVKLHLIYSSMLHTFALAHPKYKFLFIQVFILIKFTRRFIQKMFPPYVVYCTRHWGNSRKQNENSYKCFSSAKKSELGWRRDHEASLTHRKDHSVLQAGNERRSR